MGYREMIGAVMCIDDMRSYNQEDVDVFGYELINSLSVRLKELVSYYYGLPGHQKMNMREIARLFDISPGRVSELHRNALYYMRKPDMHNKPTMGVFTQYKKREMMQLVVHTINRDGKRELAAYHGAAEVTSGLMNQQECYEMARHLETIIDQLTERWTQDDDSGGEE